MAKKKKKTKKEPKDSSPQGEATIATKSQQKKRKQHESPLTQQHELTNPTTTTSTTNGRKQQKEQKYKKKKKSKKALKEEAEERRLTALLFGGGTADGASNDANDNDNNDDYDDMKRQQLKQQVLEEEEEEEGGEPSSLQFEIDRTGVAEEEKEDQDKDEQFASSNWNEDDDSAEEEEEEEEENSSTSNDEDEDDHDSDNDGGPAWVDEDDDQVEVDLLNTDRLKKLRKTRSEDEPLKGSDFQKRLRARYKTTMQATAQTQWARLDKTDNDDNDDDHDDPAAALQSSSQPLLLEGASVATRLPPNILNVMRCPDANQAEYNQAVVQAINFHSGSDPDKPLLLTAGLDKTLRFFHVSAEKSEKIHGIHFPKLPIYSAHFLGDTGKVVVSGRRPFFYIYDSIVGKLDHIPKILGREEKSWERCFPSPDGKMIAFVGNDGYIILLDVRSKQWLASLKMNGSVRAITFTPDNQYILASGSDGDVYRWEIASRKCVERFTNQDGTITSYLAASSRRQLAVGSESGVVNLYADEIVLQRKPRGLSSSSSSRSPIKSIMNLQTSADMIRYNHDGQILAMSSRREKDSLKLLHVPTSTVFSNWPTSKTPLGYVSCLDFSPQSKFLAVGNDKGKCLLYQLQHYSQS